MSDIKYSGRLFPVQAGQLISIAGKIACNVKRFVVNLTSANEQGNDFGDIQLHISTRFDEAEPVVVRNTHNRGAGWAAEERRENVFSHNNLNPFKRGGDFKIDIFVDQAAFFISIDGKPYCTFKHRLPFNAIQMIKILGDVEAVYQVNQTKAQERPWPAINPNVFEAFVPAQFNPGNVVVVTAVPKGSCSGDFIINFYDGSNRFAIFFHLRVYLETRTVVVNSKSEMGEWVKQESAAPQPFPFNISQTFKLAVAMTNNEFQVAANGCRLISMPLRTHQDRLFGNLTGIEISSNKGLSLDVKSVDYKNVDCVCGGFESFTKL